MTYITRIKTRVFFNHQFIQNEEYLEKSKQPDRPRLVSNIPNLEPDRVLSLLGNEKKAITYIDPVFFPFLFQNLTEIVMFYSRIKNRGTKLYIYTLKDFPGVEEEKHWKSLKDFFVHYLADIGVEFEFLDTNSFDAIKINNFFIIPQGFSLIGVKMLSSRIKKYLQRSNVEPFRKIFVARKDYLAQRIDDQKEVQEFFIDQGFEIVYPESFETFIDQINYFSECKVIAGISGSALSNCIFMKPGGTVIELLSVFKGEEDIAEIHHFYRIMANAMRHLYFSVSNLSGKAEDFENNKKALKTIEML
jgi:hypothetical protein